MIQNISSTNALAPTTRASAPRATSQAPEAAVDQVQLNGAPSAPAAETLTASAPAAAAAPVAAPAPAPAAAAAPAPAPAASNAPAALFMSEAPAPAEYAAGPVLDTNDPRYGLKCGAFLRPDPFFSDKSLMVVHAAKTGNNPGGITEMPYGKFQVIETSQLVTGKNEVLIGFGQPKVSTLIPRADGGGKDLKSAYQKLDAAPYFKRDAKIASGETLQSGVFIRPRNLPPEALDGLRSAMQEMTEHRSLSSARANGKMLTKAGFTSQGSAIKNIVPVRLFKQIAEHGLEYKGQPVKFDILSTTNKTLDEHFRSVLKETIESPIHSGTDDTPTNPVPAPPEPTNPTDPNNPAPANNGPKLLIRNSRPGVMASALRALVHAHIMWEAVPSSGTAELNKLLPETLKDKFHDDQPLTTKEKLKSVLFTPAKVKFIRANMAKSFDEAGSFTPPQIAEMLRIPGGGEELQPDAKGRIMYNMVICGDKSDRGNRVVIARLKVADKEDVKADDILSKHVLISGYDKDVRFAGEMWAERYTKTDGSDGVRLNFNNNSGTYRPSPEQCLAAAKYLEGVFPGVEIVAHPVTAEPPKGKPDYLTTYAVSPSQASALKAGLAGKSVTLHDSKGGASDFKIRPFTTMEFDTKFFDDKNGDIEKSGGMVRSRTRYKSVHGDKIKSVEMEAKLPNADAKVPYQNRVKGGEYKSLEEWKSKLTNILSPKTHDDAVRFGRQVVPGGQDLVPVADKNSLRQMFLVSPSTPVIGFFKPSFIISLDTNVMREAGSPRPTADPASKGKAEDFSVLTPEIFTKLPWTKKVTPDRVAQMEDLSKQLGTEFGLTPSTQSPFQEAMDHMPKA